MRWSLPGKSAQPAPRVDQSQAEPVPFDRRAAAQLLVDKSRHERALIRGLQVVMERNTALGKGTAFNPAYLPSQLAVIKKMAPDMFDDIPGFVDFVTEWMEEYRAQVDR